MRTEDVRNWVRRRQEVACFGSDEAKNTKETRGILCEIV